MVHTFWSSLVCGIKMSATRATSALGGADSANEPVLVAFFMLIARSASDLWPDQQCLVISRTVVSHLFKSMLRVVVPYDMLGKGCSSPSHRNEDDGWVAGDLQWR